jgi:hypothetical protein
VLAAFFRKSKMGFLSEIAGPLGAISANASIPVLVAACVAAFVVLSVVINVLRQLLFKDASRPPVVFHWFPVIGSTITYGMDPYKFFFANREKVSLVGLVVVWTCTNALIVWRCLYLYTFGQEDDCLLGYKGKQLYSQWQDQRR